MIGGLFYLTPEWRQTLRILNPLYPWWVPSHLRSSEEKFWAPVNVVKREYIRFIALHHRASKRYQKNMRFASFLGFK